MAGRQGFTSGRENRKKDTVHTKREKKYSSCKEGGVRWQGNRVAGTEIM